MSDEREERTLTVMWAVLWFSLGVLTTLTVLGFRL